MADGITPPNAEIMAVGTHRKTYKAITNNEAAVSSTTTVPTDGQIYPRGIQKQTG